MSRRNIIVKLAVILAVGIVLIFLLIFYSSMQSNNVITKTEPNSSNNDEMVKYAGTQDITNFSNFEELSEKTDIPSAPQVEEVKFLMIGVDSDNPQLWFINSKKYDYHYDFFTLGLGYEQDLEMFNYDTYFTNKRKNLAGTIVFHSSWKDGANKSGLFTVEFWPSDPVAPKFISLAYNKIAAIMSRWTTQPIAYYANSETQREIVEEHADKLSKSGVVTISTEKLFKNIAYIPMNTGVSFGYLRIMDGVSTITATVRDIVVFKTLPNDLGHVAGTITDEPQTPLSHVNLKAKQNKTPNCYLKNATQNSKLLAFVNKLIRYEVKPDSIDIREATSEETVAWLKKIRPPKEQNAVSDLQVNSILPFSELGYESAKSFGAKTANIAEMNKFLPSLEVDVPDGWGIPFSFYDQFMRSNDFYERIQVLLNSSKFMNDPVYRDKKLKQLRKAIRNAPMPENLAIAIADIEKEFPQGTPIRCRSSTNNEDLIGFSGAGLYDSYTYRPGKSSLAETVKKVWASTWNFRAFEEREFFRINHFSTMMGVTLHLNQDEELANGVVVTKNIYDLNWSGFYINVQTDENLVTNPQSAATPDELLVAAIGENGKYEIQYIRHSNLIPAGQTVLTSQEIRTLIESMEKVRDHFKIVYGKSKDKNFAMEVEFKVTKEGRLLVKQARPWVD